MNPLIDEIKFDLVREQAYTNFSDRIQHTGPGHASVLDISNEVFDIVEGPRKQSMQKLRGFDEPRIR